MGQHGGRAHNSPQFLSTFYNMSAVGSSYLLLDWHFIGVFFFNLSFQAYNFVACWGSEETLAVK